MPTKVTTACYENKWLDDINVIVVSSFMAGIQSWLQSDISVSTSSLTNLLNN
jgi:hypothetical protein